MNNIKDSSEYLKLILEQKNIIISHLTNKIKKLEDEINKIENKLV